jgi:sucrose-6-phosphate hydrolase SacC (GH32 family)
VIYDATTQALVCGNHRVALCPVNGRVRLQILLDRTSLEIFGNDGEVYLPIRRPLKSGHASVAVVANDSVTLQSLEVHELKSAWNK